MSLYWYDYRILDQLPEANAYPGMEAWRSIAKAFQLMLIDRCAPIRSPIRTLLDPKMELPDPARFPAKSFAECCMGRALDLVAQSEQLDKPIYLMFSGGLDSTTVAVSFLRACGVSRLRERLKIVTTTDAWTENPNFVQTHLAGNFEFFSARSYNHYCDGRGLLVNGDPSEFGIFGSQKVAGQAQKGTQTDELYAYLCASGLAPVNARTWTDTLIQGVRKAPIEISTFTDLLWWVRFSWTWQYTCYQSLSTVDPALAGISNLEQFHSRIYPFFDTPDFQVWAMVTNTDRSARKSALRAFILEFTHDEQWISQKGKFNSMASLRQFKKRTIGIDEEFKALYSLDEVLAHFDPGNLFA